MIPHRLRALPLILALLCASTGAAEVDPGLLSAASADGRTEVLLVLEGAGETVSIPAPIEELRARRRFRVDALRTRAAERQAPLLDWLEARGIEHRAYWIVNLVWARVDSSELAELAARPDLARIAANPAIRARLPEMAPESAARAVEWGVAKINAPAVWAEGFTGQGVVIGGQDTGYQWDHPALERQYRGWNGASADHNRNWHDAIHAGGSTNICGFDLPAPCDDYGHGTHTAGTFAGDDGAGHQVGVAPGARWIGCRNMNDGVGTPARYIECMQWFLAPTDLAGNDPDPDFAPDIINNSWGCPPEEGCTVGNEVTAAVQQLVDAGIFFVAAAGNEGSDCATIVDPPATVAASFVVGATNNGDALAGFSSRGPVTGGGRVRPDVVAPGVSVRSSVPGSQYGLSSGTSMATPHVAGAAALLMSINPALRGHPEAVADLLRDTAEQDGISDPWNSGCGGLDIGTWPNHQAGHGRIDVYRAALAAGLGDLIFRDGFDAAP